jgi:hypothetical protein
MARPLRIEYPGAFYHVMNRGQSRRNIFMEAEGQQSFLDLLADIARLSKTGSEGVGRTRENVGSRENVIGEICLFTDEGARDQREAA